MPESANIEIKVPQSSSTMSRAAAQIGLFDAPEVAEEAPPPDPVFARKHLNRLLRLAQAAEEMPWPPEKARMWADLFPQLAEALPEEEAQEYCRSFASEMDRLRR